MSGTRGAEALGSEVPAPDLGALPSSLTTHTWEGEPLCKAAQRQQ